VVISEFAIPTGWFGRVLARPLISGLYLSSAGSPGCPSARCRIIEPALSAAASLFYGIALGSPAC